MRADLLRLMRPWQWYKNLIVFVALLFSNNAFSVPLYRPALITFGAFCLLASGVYAWNDVVDRDEDAAHPRKRDRPVASGRVSPTLAVVLGLGLFLGAGLLFAATNAATLVLGGGYLLLQLLYMGLLKRHPVVDVVAIGVGFVLRALAGTTAIMVGAPTQWLILCTFLFALFLALAKRRHDLLVFGALDEPVPARRATLQVYTIEYTEKMTNITAALVLTSYFLYTFFGTTPWMMLTIPFAVFGVFRYLFLVEQRDLKSETELLFHDRPILVATITWLIVVVLVLRNVPQDFFAWLGAYTA